MIIDITVMHKEIAFPLDGEPCDKARRRLLKLARKSGIRSMRTYARLAREFLGKTCRLGSRRKFKQMKGTLEELRHFTEAVAADISRQLPLARRPGIRERIEEELALTERIVKQQSGDRNKLHSLSEPHVDCISKGKTRMPFEFGVKSSLAVTHKERFVVGAMTFPGCPNDGHTLAEALGQAQEMTGVRPWHVFADRSCRGHGVEGPEVFISGQRKGVTPALRRDIRRRAAIEPVFGHMKSDGRLARCPLKWAEGDMLHAIMCGCEQSIRMILAGSKRPRKGRREKAQAPRHADGAATHLTFRAVRGRHRRSQRRRGRSRMRERR